MCVFDLARTFFEFKNVLNTHFYGGRQAGKRSRPHRVVICPNKKLRYFGHEAIILGGTFFDNLQRATASLGFTLSLSNFHIRAKQEGPQMTKSTVIRIPRQVFEAFLIRVNKQKDFLTEAVNSSLEKQVKLRETCHKLILKWDEEERRRQAQMSMRETMFFLTPTWKFQLRTDFF